MTVGSARDALLNIVWGVENQDKVTVRILDRLAPTNQTEIPFERIHHVGKHYLETEGGKIPLHRVLSIFRGGVLIWERASR